MVLILFFFVFLCGVIVYLYDVLGGSHFMARDLAPDFAGFQQLKILVCIDKALPQFLGRMRHDTSSRITPTR
jgi:hypothetical protein